MRLGTCGDPGEACFMSYPLTGPVQPGGVVGPGPAIQPVGQVQPVESPAIPQQVMPASTTMTMPGMVMTAQVVSPNPKPTLTPQDLLRPLPTIVDNQPTSVAQCNSFSDWVDQNPLLAGGLLLGLAFVVFGRKG